MKLDYEVLRAEKFIDKTEEPPVVRTYLTVKFVDDQGLKYVSKVAVDDDPADIDARIREETPFWYFEKVHAAQALLTQTPTVRHVGRKGSVE